MQTLNIVFLSFVVLFFICFMISPRAFLTFLFPDTLANIRYEAFMDGVHESDKEDMGLLEDDYSQFMDDIVTQESESLEESLSEQRDPSFSYEKEFDHLLYNELNFEEIPERPFCVVGNTIHLKSKRGLYKVTETNEDNFTVTCNKWQKEFDRAERHSPFEVYSWTNFKCLAGGNHNIV